jgi:ABC-type multidrug transport system ATPase subunit
MGSSGAGKTTLLDVLAQRKTDGTINGSIMDTGSSRPSTMIEPLIVPSVLR